MNDCVKCQVVVIGGGLSGLFAAIRCAELGLTNICVLEVGKALGGNGRMAATFVSSDFSDYGDYQSDSNAIGLFRRTMKGLRHTGNPAVIQRYLFRTRDIAKWLEARNLPMAPLTWGPFQSDCSRNVESPGYNDGLAPSLGTNVCKILIKELEKYPAIHVYPGTRATRLLQDQDGTVNGVVAEIAGEELQVEAEKVILACGGVAGSEESMAAYTPKCFSEGDSMLIRGVRTCVGDGIRMAGELGADTDNYIQIHLLGPEYGGYSGPLFSPFTDVLRDARNLVVSVEGLRVADESGFMDFQELTNTLPGKRLYGILDQKAMEMVWPERRRGDIALSEIRDKFHGDMQKGFLCIAGDIREAAAFIGCSTEVLQSTVEKYNSFCSTGVDLDYRKPKEYLVPVRTAPYYVLCGIRAVDSTNGGIRINEAFEAVKPDGTPIPGMYVTGDHATGFVSEHYAPGGAGMTWAMVSGYIAGEDAATTILNS